VGLIGAGNIASHHLPAYLEHPDRVKLAAVCDLDEAAARRRAAEGGVERVYTDAGRMLREAAIDAVDICTIHDQHAPLALAAIEAGKHVLIEKPFACSLAECRAIVTAGERAGVTVMVAQNQRFLRSYRAAKAVLDSGELGTIRGVRFDSMQCWPALLAPGHWQFDAERAGGGVVICVAVHRIDLMRYLVGEVRRVTAVCRTTRPEFVNGAEDYALATLEFENGALGEMFATVSAFRMPWSEQFMIFGDQGAMHAAPAPGNIRGPAVVASDARSPACGGWFEQVEGFEPIEVQQDGLPSESGQVNEILHFADCCRTGEEPISSGRDNLGTMKIVFAIYESSARNAPVELADLA
jgi:predicted dehydrogenase